MDITFEVRVYDLMRGITGDRFGFVAGKVAGWNVYTVRELPPLYGGYGARAPVYSIKVPAEPDFDTFLDNVGDIFGLKGGIFSIHVRCCCCSCCCCSCAHPCLPLAHAL